MIGMATYPDTISELQIGKAGEYLVCADLILKGFVAYPSEQGLPYDVVMDFGGRLIKIQVKTTKGLRNVLQRKTPSSAYIFNIKRHGKNNKCRHTSTTCHLFALVALDTKEIGYVINKEAKDTMYFRPAVLKGSYRDENINIKTTGRYLADFTLNNCLQSL